MRRDHRQLAHFGAPIVFLLAVTIFVLILRGGFGGGSDSKPVRAKPSTTASSTVTNTSPRTVTTRLYTIRSGDTLGAVAIHFGVSVDDIMALNPNIEPTALRVGQKIKVGKAPAPK
ncbi:MAG: LysM domain-containing protein [Gaiellaceae bacterium]